MNNILWKKTSDYSISNGRFHIAKALAEGEPKYTLWDNTTIVGTWADSSAAKKAAEDLQIEGMK